MKSLNLFALLVLSILLITSTACNDDNTTPPCECTEGGNPDFYAGPYVPPTGLETNIPQINLQYDNFFEPPICGLCTFDVVFTDMATCDETSYTGLSVEELTGTFAAGCFSTYMVEVLNGGNPIATICDVTTSSGPACRY